MLIQPGLATWRHTRSAPRTVARTPPEGRFGAIFRHLGPCGVECRERQPERFGPFPGSENTFVSEGTRSDSVSIMPVSNGRILKSRRWSTVTGTCRRYGEIKYRNPRVSWLLCSEVSVFSAHFPSGTAWACYMASNSKRTAYRGADPLRADLSDFPSSSAVRH